MDGCVAVAETVAGNVAVAMAESETVAVAEINPSTINPSAIPQSIHDGSIPLIDKFSQWTMCPFLTIDKFSQRTTSNVVTI